MAGLTWGTKDAYVSISNSIDRSCRIGLNDELLYWKLLRKLPSISSDVYNVGDAFDKITKQVLRMYVCIQCMLRYAGECS